MDIDCDDKAEWTTRYEGIYISILHEHVKKGDLQTSTFSKKTWAIICDELFAEINRRYTVPQLKSKLNRLRKKHREFSSLINHTGFKWDTKSKTVIASDEVWEEYLKRVPGAKPYRRRGLDYYDLLGEIFNITAATGQMNFLSSKAPPSSDEDHEVEENLLFSGVHVNLSEDVGETDPQVENSKGKRVPVLFNQSPSDRRSKSICDKIEHYMEMCYELMSYKLEKHKSKAQQSNPREPLKTDLFPTAECIQIAEAMGVDDDTYVKFVEKVVDIEWRKAFLAMTDERRRVWLSHLSKTV